MTAFFLLVCSIATSMLVIPLAWRLAPHIGMVDQPDARKVHKLPVPRVGGWGIVAGCLLPLLLLGLSDPLLQSFMAGALVLFVFGAWDDARQISHWPKFGGQLLAVGLVVFWGGLYITRLPFIDGDALDPLAGKLFTMVAMVGVINAINHSDGLDGLAAGETLLSLIAVGFLGYLADAPLVAHLALVVNRCDLRLPEIQHASRACLHGRCRQPGTRLRAGLPRGLPDPARQQRCKCRAAIAAARPADRRHLRRCSTCVPVAA